jgi:hypothetical protein
MTASIIIDIVTIGLLATTIFYTVTLNRRIQLIHQNRDELKDLMSGFSSALERAEISVDKLKTSSHEAIHSLRANLEEARKLREDLQYLVDRGENIADKLEDGIREKRDVPFKKFAQDLGAPVVEELALRRNADFLRESDEQILSEVKQKLIGRLKTLK